MAEIGLLKEAGAIAFTDGARSVTNAQVMRRALTYARDFDALIVHHVEDPDLVGQGVMNEGEFAVAARPSRHSARGRDGDAGARHAPRAPDRRPLSRGDDLLRRFGGDRARRARRAGLPVTCGVSINHLALNENDIGDYRTFLKLSPPLRHEDDRQAMIEALADGTIDVIVSDHNPQDVETKRLPFAEAADGAVGLETLLSAALRLVHADRISLPQLLRALSTRPAEILGLPAGRLKRRARRPTSSCSIPTRPTCSTSAISARCSKNTPFDEARLEGQVTLTMVAGRIVFDRRSRC